MLLQFWFVIKPRPALIHSQTTGTLEDPTLGIPELPEELTGVVNVVVRQGNAGHDPVYPAHAPGCLAVHGGDLIAAANSPGNGANLETGGPSVRDEGEREGEGGTVPERICRPY